MWMKLPPAINNCPNRKRRKCETLNPQQQLFELFSLTTFKVLKSRKAISQRKDQFKFLHEMTTIFLFIKKRMFNKRLEN